MADETGDKDAQLSFKVKTGKDGLYIITIAETATVLDLKTKLSGDEYAKVPAGRQRLIYSGRVLKDGDVLKDYKIKDGNTLHMVERCVRCAASCATHLLLGKSILTEMMI